jgi:hypothetical protein
MRRVSCGAVEHGRARHVGDPAVDGAGGFGALGVLAVVNLDAELVAADADVAGHSGHLGVAVGIDWVDQQP